MATYSSILAWRTPRTERPGGLWSRRSQRVGHNWRDWTCREINSVYASILTPSPPQPHLPFLCYFFAKNDAVMMNWGRIPTEQGLWHFYKVGPWDPRNSPFSPRKSYKLHYRTYCAQMTKCLCSSFRPGPAARQQKLPPHPSPHPGQRKDWKSGVLRFSFCLTTEFTRHNFQAIWKYVKSPSADDF